MKYKTFKAKVNSLGFNTEHLGHEVRIIVDIAGWSYVPLISIDREDRYMVTILPEGSDVLRDLPEVTRGKLMNLAVEYSNFFETKEEKSHWILEDPSEWYVPLDYSYFNLISTGGWQFGSNVETSAARTRFTEYEFEDLKEKYKVIPKFMKSEI